MKGAAAAQPSPTHLETENKSSSVKDVTDRDNGDKKKGDSDHREESRDPISSLDDVVVFVAILFALPVFVATRRVLRVKGTSAPAAPPAHSARNLHGVTDVIVRLGLGTYGFPQNSKNNKNRALFISVLRAEVRIETRNKYEVLKKGTCSSDQP